MAEADANEPLPPTTPSCDRTVSRKKSDAPLEKEDYVNTPSRSEHGESNGGIAASRPPPSSHRKVAIFADYDSCFDVVNPLIQDHKETTKYSRAYFKYWNVLDKRDAAVKILDSFLEEVCKDATVYLFVGSSRQSLAFDKILGRNNGGFEAIGGGAYEAIAADRGWTMNYALLADVPNNVPRWCKDSEGAGWNDLAKRQPIEPGDSRTTKEDDQRLKLMMVENNFLQLPAEEFGEVDCYFFDDRNEFLDYTRERCKIPSNINFYTVRWDFMGYIVDGWTAESHPIVAKKAERS